MYINRERYIFRIKIFSVGSAVSRMGISIKWSSLAAYFGCQIMDHSIAMSFNSQCYFASHSTRPSRLVVYPQAVLRFRSNFIPLDGKWNKSLRSSRYTVYRSISIKLAMLRLIRLYSSLIFTFMIIHRAQILSFLSHRQLSCHIHTEVTEKILLRWVSTLLFRTRVLSSRGSASSLHSKL